MEARLQQLAEKLQGQIEDLETDLQSILLFRRRKVITKAAYAAQKKKLSGQQERAKDKQEAYLCSDAGLHEAETGVHTAWDVWWRVSCSPRSDKHAYAYREVHTTEG